MTSATCDAAEYEELTNWKCSVLVATTDEDYQFPEKQSVTGRLDDLLENIPDHDARWFDATSKS